MTFVAYVLMMVAPRQKVGRYVMWWSLGYLCWNHAYRFLYMFGTYSIDISTFTMCQVCKLSALGYNYHDGIKPEEKLT